MNNLEREEALARLRLTGWTPREIEHLCQLRQRYAQRQRGGGQEHQHSVFVRWLVTLLREGTPVPLAPWWWKEYR
jgi:type II secretory pathway component PulF